MAKICCPASVTPSPTFSRSGTGRKQDCGIGDPDLRRTRGLCVAGEARSGLAAEQRFHSEPTGGDDIPVMSCHHGCEALSKVWDPQMENVCPISAAVARCWKPSVALKRLRKPYVETIAC